MHRRISTDSFSERTTAATDDLALERDEMLDMTVSGSQGAAVDLDEVLRPIGAVVGEIPMEALTRQQGQPELVENCATCFPPLHEAWADADEVGQRSSRQLSKRVIGILDDGARRIDRGVSDYDSNGRLMGEGVDQLEGGYSQEGSLHWGEETHTPTWVQV